MIRRLGPFAADLDELAWYIARDNLAAAERLVDAVAQTLVLLERLPRIGRAWPSAEARLHDVRHRAVAGFPNHIVFYRPIDGGIEALRLLHAARDLEHALTSGDV